MTELVVRTVLERLGWNPDVAELTPLSGGVSCETFAVHTDQHNVVVKQALAELKVAERWESDPSRIEAEALALRWFHSLTPQFVPEPLGVFPDLYAMVLPQAPEPSPDLRELVLRGHLERAGEWGATLASLLDIWHRQDPSAARGGLLDDDQRLRSLRLDPFYRDLAMRWPERSGPINAAGEELLDHRIAVVHGDFTPKNVLVHEQGIWLIDPEVAHIGNPVLDTASMLAHALIKQLHWRHDETASWQMGQFIEAFWSGLDHSPSSRPESLGIHTGVIIGVRAAGRSPVSYLGDDTRDEAVSLAQRLIDGADIREVWS